MAEQEHKGRKIIAVYFNVGNGGVGKTSSSVLRAKEDRCEFHDDVENQRLHIKRSPPGSLSAPGHVFRYTVPYSNIRYWEYEPE